MRGEPFLYPGAVTALIRDYLRARARRRRRCGDPLTPRETEVVKLIAEGHTNREIAETLVISEKTVERHRANILEKLGMRDRVELTRYAIRRGLDRAVAGAGGLLPRLGVRELASARGPGAAGRAAWRGCRGRAGGRGGRS